MNPALVALVLLAAILHASWNAMLKGGNDRFKSIVIMNVAASAACVPAAILLPAPRPECWLALLVSSFFHVGYNLCLVRAYAHGDLGQVYPIARGSSPLLVTLGAAMIAGETPSLPALAGVVLVSFGIFVLAKAWTQGPSASGIRAALLTGIWIAAYTLTDGLGARLSGNAPAYAAWLFIAEGLPMPVVYWAARGWHSPAFGDWKETCKAAAGGIVSLLAYGSVIFAASIGPMGTVSALRETSVVFAALLGQLFLSERLTPRKFAACMIVALGAVLLGSHP